MRTFSSCAWGSCGDTNQLTNPTPGILVWTSPEVRNWEKTSALLKYDYCSVIYYEKKVRTLLFITLLQPSHYQPSFKSCLTLSEELIERFILLSSLIQTTWFQSCDDLGEIPCSDNPDSRSCRLSSQHSDLCLMKICKFSTCNKLSLQSLEPGHTIELQIQFTWDTNTALLYFKLSVMDLLI